MTLAAFLVNAVFSVLGAWLCALAASTAFRRTPGLAKWAFLLPLLKLVVDAARGLDANAFVRTAYAGHRLDQGRFQIGGGLSAPFFPIFNGHLWARVGASSYPMSAGELAAHGAARGGFRVFLVVAAALCVAVSVFRVGKRVLGMSRFERQRRRSRAVATAHPAVRVDVRRVDVYVDAAFRGTPFTGGLFRPYVCFPADAYAAMTEAERRAALEHELSHVCAGDAWLLTAAALVVDLAWFVPGIAHLGTKVRRLAERAADEGAVKRGANPVALASAVVRLAELGGGPAGAVAFTTPDHPVVERVQALFERAPSSDTPVRTVLRWAAFAACAYAALASRFLS